MLAHNVSQLESLLMSRTREREFGGFNLSGTLSRVNTVVPAVNVTQTQSGPARATTWEQCVDSLGKSVGHPLLLRKVTREFKPLNGTLTEGPNTYTAKDFYPYMSLDMEDRVHGPSTLPDVTTATTRLRAGTNPGRATLSLYAAIAELRDLPRMLRTKMLVQAAKNPKSFGKKGPRNAGSLYLEWKFGWEPLIRDLSNLMNAVDQIDPRIKEVIALHSNGGLRRRLRLGNSGQMSESGPHFFHTIGTKLFGFKSKSVTTGEMWGTVRWLPSQLPGLITPPPSRKLVYDAITGKSGNHISDVWQLLPWSWMGDWFSNMGSFLEAHANRIPCVATEVWIMRHQRTVTSWERADSQLWAAGGTGSSTYETKERLAGNDSLSVYLPYLNGGQLSILGALASSRSRFGR